MYHATIPHTHHSLSKATILIVDRPAELLMYVASEHERQATRPAQGQWFEHLKGIKISIKW